MRYHNPQGTVYSSISKPTITSNPNPLRNYPQIMVSELLRRWGDDGFRKHIAKLREFYRAQRDTMLKAAEKHLTGQLWISESPNDDMLLFETSGGVFFLKR